MAWTGASNVLIVHASSISTTSFVTLPHADNKMMPPAITMKMFFISIKIKGSLAKIHNNLYIHRVSYKNV